MNLDRSPIIRATAGAVSTSGSTSHLNEKDQIRSTPSPLRP